MLCCDTTRPLPPRCTPLLLLTIGGRVAVRIAVAAATREWMRVRCCWSTFQHADALQHLPNRVRGFRGRSQCGVAVCVVSACRCAAGRCVMLRVVLLSLWVGSCAASRLLCGPAPLTVLRLHSSFPGLTGSIGSEQRGGAEGGRNGQRCVECLGLEYTLDAPARWPVRSSERGKGQCDALTSLACRSSTAAADTNMSAPTPLFVLRGHRAPIHALCFHNTAAAASSALTAVGAGASAHALAASSTHSIARPAAPSAASTLLGSTSSFSSASSLSLCSGDAQGVVRVWNLATRRSAVQVDAHPGAPVLALQSCKDGTLITSVHQFNMACCAPSPRRSSLLLLGTTHWLQSLICLLLLLHCDCCCRC